MPERRFFASDNTSRVHDRIMQALIDANRGAVPSYGDDAYTHRAVSRFKEIFGADTDVFFVYNGTGANVTAVATLTRPYHAVITTETAHINEDECGAPVKFTGCPLHTVASFDGKLRVEQIRHWASDLGNPHRSQPGIVSITQSTELGTVYSPEEIREIADFAHAHGLYLHMDGARVANAAAGLDRGLREITRDAGVDVLSFGGTKNGMMFGEAVLFLRPGIAGDFPYFRKQGMQLASKMRYIAAQFEALLEEDLWLENAHAANTSARLLADRLSSIPGVRLTRAVESNAVFAVIPGDIIPKLLETNYFYVWNERLSEVRLMTSFDTTTEEVFGLADDIKQAFERRFRHST